MVTRPMGASAVVPGVHEPQAARPVERGARSAGDMPREVEDAWTTEIARRMARIRDGETEAIPWAEARGQLLARLRER